MGAKFDYLLGKVRTTDSGGGTSPADVIRITNLENHVNKVTYFASVNAAPGAVTVPTGGTILLDEFESGIDAYVSTIVNGKPTGIFPKTAGGVEVDVSSFDASGNFVLTGTPSAFPVAIIYKFSITQIQYDANVVIGNVLDLETIRFGYKAGDVPQIGTDLAASQILASDANKKIQPLDTATYPSLTELSYIKGLTSAIQTQLAAFLKKDGSVALTADWNAGAFIITIKSVAISGTGGAGFMEYIAQASNAAAPAGTGFRLFANSVGGFSWAVKNGADTYARIFASTFTADHTQTYQDVTDTFVYRATTDTLTNKRFQSRTGTVTSSATPTINTDNVDYFSITALAAAITSMTTNLSGTPTANDTLWIAITDNGTARAITWGASFEASGTLALPTTTVISTRLDVGFTWNEVTSKWRICAVN